MRDLTPVLPVGRNLRESINEYNRSIGAVSAVEFTEYIGMASSSVNEILRQGGGYRYRAIQLAFNVFIKKIELVEIYDHETKIVLVLDRFDIEPVDFFDFARAAKHEMQAWLNQKTRRKLIAIIITMYLRTKK